MGRVVVPASPEQETFREDAASAERVLELLVQWEELHVQGRTPTAEELCPDDADLLPGLRDAIRRRLLLQGLLEPPTPSPSDGPTPVPSIPGYELLEVIGYGGMGVVYKARHRELNRLVALKMIRSGSHAGPEERARFRTEAEAVARVHHPNIVQIYEVGQSDGHPYLALEFVSGGSLAQRLDGTPWPARRAAELLQTLARSIQHAHERNLVHRDLKPGNVLLSHDELPKITDFGLAKRLDLDQGHTHTGAVLGSPCYMAPEQADSKVGVVGPAADIYALGAILYELLTGRPPARGATPLETVYQVRQQEPAPPRSLQLGVPRDLEVITLKCLRKEPQKRYRTAQELADDLHRFLNGRPIFARPVGELERAWRWCKRHRAVACLGLILGVTIVAGIIGMAWQWHRAEGEAKAARDERERALRQWSRAEANFERAKAAVDRMTAVGRDLVGQPRLDKTGRQILEEALAFYQAFLEEKADDPAMQKEVARACMRTGDIQARLGEWQKAEATYRKGIPLLEALAAAPDAPAATSMELALCVRACAHVLRNQNRTAESGEAYRRAFVVVEEMLAKHPDSLNFQETQANTLMNWSIVHRAEGRWDEAVKSCRHAAELLRTIQARRPRVATQLEIALALDELSVAQRMTNHLAEAEIACREALAIREQVHAGNTKEPAYRDYVARSHSGLASILIAKGAAEDGVASHRLAVALWDALATEFPNRPDYRRALANCHSLIGATLIKMEKLQEAEPSLRACLALRKKLAAEFPREPVYTQDLVVVLSRLGKLLFDTGRRSEAAGLFKQVVAIQPTSPISFNQIAWFLLTCPDVTMRDSRRALTLARTATEQSHTSADAWNTLGFAQYREGMWAAAIDSLEKSVKLRRQPDPVDALVLAMACQRLGRTTEAQRWYEQGLQIAKSTGANADDVKELRAEAEALLGKP